MQTYTVQVERQDSPLVRTFTLELGAKRADPQAGFNPVETLLSSFGACLLTGLQFVAESSKIVIASAWIQLEATRQEKPPTLERFSERKRPSTPLERLYPAHFLPLGVAAKIAETAITRIRYKLHFQSSAPRERLEHLIELAQRNSTVFQTLSLAVPIESEWEVAS